jgi:TolA-binding protein
VTVRRVLPLLLALSLGVACSLLVACGGRDTTGLIPANQASAMTDELDKIDAAVRRGRCTGVDKQVATLQGQVNDLSRKVDSQLRSQLQKGVQNLNDIAFNECSDNAQTTQTTPTTTTPTTPTQTETVTTQTETVPTQTVTTQTVPPVTATTPTTPPVTTPTTPDSGGGAGIPDGTGGVDTTGGAGGATPTP